MNLSVNFNLALEASNGKDNFKQGVVGSNNFGFAFIDMKKADSLMEYNNYLSQLCSLRDPQDFIRRIEFSNKDFSDFLIKSNRDDIKLAGSVKTLVPSVEYGGYESLFEVVVITRTPEKHFFPLIFYYGVSGLALSAFNITSWLDKGSFGSYFNYNPFNYNKQNVEILTEAFHLALLKVPSSNYFGVYNHDFGNTLMGLKGRRIINIELEDDIDPSFVSYLYSSLI